MKLLSSLIKTRLPLWYIDILLNLYGELSVAVGWNCIPSQRFLSQSSSLSPAIFNVFIKVFTASLRSLKLGCCINNEFVGYVNCAEYIFSISASVAGLQSMLDCCLSVSIDLGLSFNCKKTYCMFIVAIHSIHKKICIIGYVAWLVHFSLVQLIQILISLQV
jgi:hypothetical protein